MGADDVGEASAVAGPLVLSPFAATRLAPARVGDPASARLLARPHRAVPERVRRWRRLGNLTQDSRPALYVHEYSTQGLTVRALVALAGVGPAAGDPASAAIVPHEDVDPAQVRELASRMRAMRVNPAPILLLHRGANDDQGLVREVVAGPPDADYVDRAGQRHRFWSVTDEERTSAIAASYARHHTVVADGHHRLAAYQQLHRDSPGTDWERGLAMLVDHSTTPLFLAAIHRVLRGVPLAALVDAVDAVGLGPMKSLDPDDAVHALAPATMVLTDGHQAWAAEIGAPDVLAVEVLHKIVLPALEIPPVVEYHHAADGALGRLSPTARGGEERVVALLPAVGYDALVSVLDAGRRLPQKATSFQPKSSLGAIMRLV
ncbi:DUF1015 family protein [Nocardioides zeae]|uniref:DUF1015 family protein n=1 Tax=Nocardioides imazamoxiresistens TaxID=3231893 RepID=A0ABU3PSM9_9ACTN|nr:DUF1015 family protein [Nocardioides zeae]MDT9592222.1 DUF1015 family protein [Nocardioides zeae]